MEHHDPLKPRNGGRKSSARASDNAHAGHEEVRIEPFSESEELRLQPLDESEDPPLLDATVGPATSFGTAPFNTADGDDFGSELPDFEVAELTTLVPTAEARPVDRPMVTAIPVAEAVSVAPPEDEEEQREQLLEAASRRKFFLTAAPSWLISLLVHLGLILILATITLDPLQKVISVLQASAGDVEPTIEQFDLQGPKLESSSNSLDDPLSIPAPTLGEVVAMPELTSPMLPTFEAKVDALELNSRTESILPSAMLNTTTLAQMSVALNSRSRASKSEMLERFGGNAASEKAVAIALQWLAAHQAPDGGWNFAHSSICRGQCQHGGDLALARNGATAMAILPFLGAGQTHLEGQYKQTVKRGLAYLINRMQVTPSNTLPMGSWHEPGGRMYSHGLASIAICEAYAMTADPDLLQPAQLSLNYLVYAQNDRDGGWRYEPKDPGDTSVVGWCLMALKSGKMGNLVVPATSFQGADRFLDFVSTNNGAYYGYNKPTAKLDGRQATIAVGLLCRMYLGYPKEHPGLQEGIQYLSSYGPRTGDLYYSYYATQVMRHHGGEVWEKWNSQLRDELIQSQEQEGHAAGSWAPSGRHSDKGGRLYATSLATMILEVYYRHMPLYSERSSDDDFEI